ncbi:MAG: PRC-barrel domain-containing protein [Candidatus Aenigmarchaeota archaeon]|nr:PRC-barrel domain-containing protein [Candidatus Aenigmarchaeota archaeon]MCK5299921.1 PRC-barrel domain-containing protein [Candidatus Aenigmarchaeota archaeon]
METIIRGEELINKTIISEQTGRTFGNVGDITFLTDTGELMNVLLVNATAHTKDLDLQQDESGRYMIPFSAIKSVGDFVIVTEKEIF